MGKAITGLVEDYEGQSRPMDGDGLGAGTTGDGSDYDIGADEAPSTYTLIQDHLLREGKYDEISSPVSKLDVNNDSEVNISDLLKTLTAQAIEGKMKP